MFFTLILPAVSVITTLVVAYVALVAIDRFRARRINAR